MATPARVDIGRALKLRQVCSWDWSCQRIEVGGHGRAWQLLGPCAEDSLKDGPWEDEC